MNTSNTSLSTAAASSSVSLAFVVILQWVLSIRGVNMTPDVSTALSVLITAIVHYLIAIRIVPTPATPVATAPTVPTITPVENAAAS
jgi:hypothetical protein